jgi:hypothetical protein
VSAVEPRAYRYFSELKKFKILSTASVAELPSSNAATASGKNKTKVSSAPSSPAVTSAIGVN